MALTDPASSSEEKAGIVDVLLEGKAAPETITLVSHVAGSLRGVAFRTQLHACPNLPQTDVAASLLRCAARWN